MSILKIRHIPQSAAALLSAVCAAVMMTVSYYGQALPDSFTTEEGSALTLSTRLPVTAASAAVTDGSRVSLKLFGSVPIKEVKETAVKRPTLIAGGQAFGIKLVTDGVMIIDMKKINGRCPAEEAGLRIGDVIEEINGEKVGSNSRISELIRSSRGSDCKVTFRRSDSKFECTLTPVFGEGSYRAGMWVRDSSAGIGTLTFADPATGAFAGLGHSICDADTHEPLPLSQGSVSGVKLSGCTKSAKGDPGQLIGEFTDEELGQLTLNCSGGVYGESEILSDVSLQGEEFPLGFSQEVREGSAYILAQLDDSGVKRYDITIERVSPIDCDHDLIIKTNDKRLLRKAGGIVQGMSGSPIIQDGRLVGAVTHVFVDDPTGGYGIFAERMYNCSLAAVSGKSAQAAG